LRPFFTRWPSSSLWAGLYFCFGWRSEIRKNECGDNAVNNRTIAEKAPPLSGKRRWGRGGERCEIVLSGKIKL